MNHAPLKICCFGWIDIDSGSVASANALLVRALHDRGHAVDVYGVEGYAGRLGVPDGEGPPVTRIALDEPGWLRAIAGRIGILGGRLRSGRYNRQFRQRVARVVYARDAHDAYDVVLSLGMRPPVRLRGRPVVVWPQSARGNELEPIRRNRALFTAIGGARAYWRARLYYELRDRLGWRWLRDSWAIYASQRSRRLAVEQGSDPARVFVVPYAFDLERFRPAEPDEGGDGGHLVVCVGRMDPRKRVDLLVPAARELAARRSDIRIEVVGRRGYLPGVAELVERATQEGLPVSVRPPMPRDEVSLLVARASAIVQPSENEELGHAVVEALASGTPAVVGPTNGTVDYLPPEGSVVFERYDGASVADAIEAAVALAERPETAAICRAAAERHFAAATVAAQVEEICRSAVA